MDPVSADILAQSESPTTILRWFTVVGVQLGRAVNIIEHVLDHEAEAAAIQSCRANPELLVVCVFEGKLFDQLPSETATRWPLAEDTDHDDTEIDTGHRDHVLLGDTPTECVR